MSYTASTGSSHSSEDGSGDRITRLRDIVAELEVSLVTVEELRSLENFDIVFICDDSGSMNEIVDEVPGGDAFRKRKTRWDELKDTVETVMRLAAALDTDGIDVYFLNRPGAAQVSNPKALKPLFAAKPKGYTPLSKAFQKVVAEKGTNEGKKLLVVIATDGEPDDGRGGDNSVNFRRVLESRNCDRIHVSILACTDNKREMEYLNEIDGKVRNVDVVDDYQSERTEVLRAHPSYRFTKGDYVAKALLGAVNPKWDNLDEKKDGCCVIL